MNYGFFFFLFSLEHRYIELFLNSTSSGAAEMSEFLRWIHTSREQRHLLVSSMWQEHFIVHETLECKTHGKSS